MEHDCKFNLTPIGYRDSNAEIGDPKSSVDNQIMPFNFDGRKLFQSIRKLTEEELRSLTIVEVTSPVPYEPKAETFVPNRKKESNTLKKVPIEE